ncbi:MAG: hypothetical protein IKW04_01085 [Clostridia bacterium]|nr:hypothetical protein [Clostridia bacterium]
MEEKRTKAKRKIKIPPVYYIVGGIILVLVIIGLYIFYHPSYSTQVVYHGSEDVVISGKGIFVWDEELLTSTTNGMAVLNYSDGTRVTAKTHVATVYSGEIDENKKDNIKSLNERINLLETTIKNQGQNSNTSEDAKSLLIKKMQNVSYYSQAGKFDSFLREAREIEDLNLGILGGSPEEELEKLKRQRDDLERSIVGSKDSFYSVSSGLITSKVDGYEAFINEKTTENLDCQMFDNLWNSSPTDYSKTQGDYVFGKIVNNYEATLLVRISNQDAEGIGIPTKENPNKINVLYLKSSRVPEGKVACTVQDVSSNGTDTVLTLTLNNHLDAFMGERKIDLELIKKTYSGLRIPKEAIQEDENGKFVFIVKESIVRKRPVKVLCESNGYVIAEEDNNNPSNVLLYDLVITEYKNLAEGSPAPNTR